MLQRSLEWLRGFVASSPLKVLLALRWLAWPYAFALVQVSDLPTHAAPSLSHLLGLTFAYNVALGWLPSKPLPPVRLPRRLMLLVGLDLLSGLLVTLLSGGWHSPFYRYSLSALLLPPYYYGSRGMLASSVALIAWHIYLSVNREASATFIVTATLNALIGGGVLILAGFVLGQHDTLWRLAERRATRLGILNRVRAIVAGNAEDEDTLLDQITAILREGSDHARLSVRLLGHSGRHGLPADQMGRTQSERRPSLAGLVVQDGQVLRISDTRRAPHYVGLDGETRSALCVPIREGERVLGALTIESPRVNALDEFDDRWSSSLADEIGIGLRRIEAEAEERESAAQEARVQMARYLHDETVQQMYGIILALKDGLRRIEPGPQRDRLQTTLNLAVRAWEDLRCFLQDLRSPLNEVTLSEVINRRAVEFTRLTGLPVHVEISRPEPSLSLEVRTSLAAMLRAALSNIYRHAQATTVRLRLWQEVGAAVLEIHDDGIGFEPSAVNESRGQLGLAGIRERAEGIGARLEIESALMKGTRLVTRVPLEGKSSDGQDQTASS